MQKACKQWRCVSSIHSLNNRLHKQSIFHEKKPPHSPREGFYTAKHAWESAPEVRGCKQNLTGLMATCQLLLFNSAKPSPKGDLLCTHLQYYRAAAKRNKHFMLGERNMSSFNSRFCSAPSRMRDFICTYFAYCPQMPPLRGICSNRLSFSNRRPCFLAAWHWQ